MYKRIFSLIVFALSGMINTNITSITDDIHKYLVWWENMEDEMPKTIIVILVVLAVAISVLGTFTVMNEMNNLRVTPVYKGTPSQSAKVKLTVQDPDVAQGLSSATGKVSLTVQRRE